eukprot:CAMPEP_0184855226 /NCGR_PEP_ID=MMETSP0580-20130426/534_1 /TAXON_ID=1118495 /ORGANISM="Dactyliosolen fragilissimus" /LENGTH=99 /DNA_ID=CAMNT_0027349683 /DNA_START=44 /DNA_END=343 /DNA_ORIENTATION=+
MRYAINSVMVLALMVTASAFVPAPSTFVTKQSASSVLFSEPAQEKELVLDTNFDDVNIVRLLGLNRVKKLARKYKRQQTDDEGEVEEIGSADESDAAEE